MNYYYKVFRASISRLRNYTRYLLSTKTKYISLDKHSKKIILFLAADYGNLGDIAITYAQREYITSNFPSHQYIEVPLSDTYSSIKSLRSKVNDDDIITIIGGGNMGDMYRYIEDQRQFVIRHFPNNRIISFPQTIDFSESRYGARELKKAIRTYSSHQKLTLLAREEKTYSAMRKFFRNNDILLTPDIVLSLDISNPDLHRENITTLCLRKDAESKLTDIQRDSLISILTERGYTARHTDTHIGNVNLSATEGTKELWKIWNKFNTSQLVITDRLHGMIFCVITKTPCIAINNSNGKVAGVYDRWIQGSNYIRTMDAFNKNKVVEHLNYLQLLQSKDFKRTDIGKDFNKIKKLIQMSN